MSKFRFEILYAVQDLEKELFSQNDRAIAIVSGSYFDCLLQWLLERYLLKDKKVVSELFKPLQPLNSFSGKIKISYCLGLISKKEYKDLNQIRDIRNIFAHQVGKISFDDQPVGDKIVELSIPQNMYVPENIPTSEKELKSISITLPKFSSNREKYEAFISYLTRTLTYRYCNTTKSCQKPIEFSNAAEAMKLSHKRIDELMSKAKELEEKVKRSGSEVPSFEGENSDDVDYVELFMKTRPYFERLIDALEAQYENIK